MKYTVVWSDFAVRQVDQIHEYYYLETKSLDITNRIIFQILSSPDILLSNPEIGPREPLLLHRKYEYRYIVVANYKLIYSVNKDKRQVRVADVFDTRQSPKKIKQNK